MPLLLPAAIAFPELVCRSADKEMHIGQLKIIAVGECLPVIGADSLHQSGAVHQRAVRRRLHRARCTTLDGRIGSSYDNALAESFFATLKRELDVDHRTWASEADARRDVFRWIAFYNHRRRHSALGYLSPADYEQRHRSVTVQQIAA